VTSRRIIEESAAPGARQRPLLCTPLVGRTARAVEEELEVVLPKGPDLLEWRVDCFEAIALTAEVLALGRVIRARAGDLPLIFTRRSTREGGEPIPLDEAGVLDLYQAVGRAGLADYLDQELSSGPADLARARAISREVGAGLIASFHDFQRTPTVDELFARLEAASRAGADVAKVAAMARSPEDVLTLLSATLRGRRELGLPLITMSMGPYGSLTRLFGWAFGSSVSFAVGAGSSAPGQLPIETLRRINEILTGALLGEVP